MLRFTTPLTRRTLPSALFTGLACLALVLVLATDASAAGAPTYTMKPQRIELPTLSAAEFYPYTVEIPGEWGIRRDLPVAGIFLGPAAASPEEHPEMIFVRYSKVSLAQPEQVVATIKNNDAANPGWTAPEVSVIELGGTKAVWVLMSYPAEGKKPARSTLTVKLPIPSGSVDVMATAPQDQFSALRPHFERVLRSLLPKPAEAPKAEETAAVAPAVPPAQP